MKHITPEDFAKAEELSKSAIVESLKNPSEDIAKAIMLAAGMNPAMLDLQKNITTGTGLVAFDLQAPAKNLYPVYTPIRNKLPRVGGGIGLATNWRQVNAIIGSGFDGSGWVAEGQRAGQMSYNTSNKAASYVTLGEEDAATFEAINAGRSFEDVEARMTMRLLQKTMLKEEMGLLWGNNSVSLGTTAAPSLSASGTGATLPAATYSVICVALTGEGWKNSSLANGVAGQKTITGADGKTFVLNGGAAQKSANATLAVTLGQTLFASVTALQGAVAYAWFVGIAGSEVLQAITPINSVAISAPLATGTQAASALTAADYSTNTLAYDGLFTTAAKNGSGAYVQYLPTGTAGTGSVLTASGRGSVNEIDLMMQRMWDTFQVSLSVIFVNSQELKNITTKCLTGASGGSLLQYFNDPKAGEYILTAGGAIEFYYNPFMAPGAGRRIPIMIHPNVPPGTIIGWAADLPIQYQNNEVPNVAEVKTRQDYYQINWPLTTRQRQVGVYSEQVLAVYAPFAMGVISNIANG
ncbi:hypothetical protein [Bradyrhizobium sp. SZCCHNRI1002]|uniref:hypothetical protein n=1 Tax=Bradyrhizobium sp. SZCCHNRI1002 TaxID=3057274 RepID=UPI0028E80A50|nr:hypothetical protein [Bradyrhizobium sp. SZCCHNRI1002]